MSKSASDAQTQPNRGQPLAAREAPGTQLSNFEAVLRESERRRQADPSARSAADGGSAGGQPSGEYLERAMLVMRERMSRFSGSDAADEYPLQWFEHFELLAAALDWPSARWCSLLGSFLDGRALDQYRLIMEDQGPRGRGDSRCSKSLAYEEMKQLLLAAVVTDARRDAALRRLAEAKQASGESVRAYLRKLLEDAELAVDGLDRKQLEPLVRRCFLRGLRPALRSFALMASDPTLEAARAAAERAECFVNDSDLVVDVAGGSPRTGSGSAGQQSRAASDTTGQGQQGGLLLGIAEPPAYRSGVVQLVPPYRQTTASAATPAASAAGASCGRGPDAATVSAPGVGVMATGQQLQRTGSVAAPAATAARPHWQISMENPMHYGRLKCCAPAKVSVLVNGFATTALVGTGVTIAVVGADLAADFDLEYDRDIPEVNLQGVSGAGVAVLGVGRVDVRLAGQAGSVELELQVVADACQPLLLGSWFLRDFGPVTQRHGDITVSLSGSEVVLRSSRCRDGSGAMLVDHRVTIADDVTLEPHTQCQLYARVEQPPDDLLAFRLTRSVAQRLQLFAAPCIVRPEDGVVLVWLMNLSSRPLRLDQGAYIGLATELQHPPASASSSPSPSDPRHVQHSPSQSLTPVGGSTRTPNLGLNQSRSGRYFY